MERELKGVPQRRLSRLWLSHSNLASGSLVCESHVKVAWFVGPVSATATTFAAAAISRQEAQAMCRKDLPSALGATDMGAKHQGP